MFSCILHGWRSEESSCPLCHKTVTTTNVVIDESEPPADIVKQLREANPHQYANDENYHRYYGWDECCDKLEELLKQNQSK